MPRRLVVLIAGLALLLVAAAPTTARNSNSMNAYVVHNLQSDQEDAAPTPADPDLVNGWGITASATSPWWVSDNGTGKSTLYNGAGAKQGLVVNVTGAAGPAKPTGVVFNGNAAFPLTNGGSDFARFIFDSEDGTISAWAGGTASTLKVTSPDGAIYKGLAIGTVSSGGTTHPYLYAADFHHARVDVYDGAFVLQHWAGAFVDPGIPAGFAPFGIQNLGGTIYVTYAKQDAAAEDEIAGPGLGYVSAFGTDGSFIGRVASGGSLNAPWGLAWAPAGWQRFGDNLLVGNFGDGRINGFGATSGGWEDRGHLKLTNHHPLVIDGLWGIGFGNGAGSGPTTSLYFAAGPDDESHGLFGSITAP